ncbi:MAG: hypothetical protein GY953_23630, partial [bacterium]|nr:hypothetical protein [bacterium]
TDNPLYETSRSEDGLLDVTTLVGTVAAEAYPEEAAVHAGREAPLTLRTWPPPELPEQPYPVLLPYTHPDLMAGCEEEIKKLHVHLQMPVPILGLGAPSGTGKSSLLAGGLVPDLRAKGPGSEPPGKQSRLLAASALQWAAQRLFGRRGRSWTPPFFQQHRLEWLTKHAMPRCPGPCARVRLSPEAVESPGKMPNE